MPVLRNPIALVLLSAALTTGCSLLDRNKVDYQDSRVGASLEVPPDLSRPEGSENLPIPDIAPRELPLVQGANPSSPNGEPAAVRLERDGAQRWLIVDRPPEALWNAAEAFWQKQGFEIERADPALGIMETNWREQRDEVPANFLGRLLEKVYSSGLRDKYRLRLEQGEQPGTSRIVIAHRGLEEVVTSLDGPHPASVTWQPRDSSPELEAEMLQRLLLHLGVRADTQLAADAQARPRAELRDQEGAAVLVVHEPFPRAWRWTGLALDRLGVVVQDRNRDSGLYYLRVGEGGEQPEQGQGWLARWFGGEDGAREPVDLRLSLADLGEDTLVTVLDGNGARERSEFARSLLAQLQEQMH